MISTFLEKTEWYHFIPMVNALIGVLCLISDLVKFWDKKNTLSFLFYGGLIVVPIIFMLIGTKFMFFTIINWLFLIAYSMIAISSFSKVSS